MTQGPAGDPVAHLATEVASLRREVSGLSEKERDVADLRETVEALARGVADLAQRVSQLVSSPAPNSRVQPYWLPALEGERAERAWRTVARWVEEVVVGRYQRSVKPCWYRHLLAVDQLTACYLSWTAAYQDEALPTAPAEWHDRWFPHLMRLVDADTKACTARKHESGEELAPSVHDGEQFEAFIQCRCRMKTGPVLPSEKGATPRQ